MTKNVISEFELPEDFDAETYLRLNPDLKKAGVDPVRHYLNHGRKELRSYKKYKPAPRAVQMHENGDPPEKKRIFIHIGMGRCGSSSLQHALRISRPELEQKGILYPETNPAHDAQHSLGLLRDDQFSTAVQAWKGILEEFETSGYGTLILSTEYFTRISDKLFDEIRSLLDGYSVTIIFITRNQRELLPSIYAQWTKAGVLFRSFGHFFRTTRKEWHFTKILERWSSAYGRENVRCGVLCPGSDAITIFAGCCEDGSLGEILQKKRIRINASINSKLLPCLKLFDRINSRNIIGESFPGWDRIEPVRPERNEFLRRMVVVFLEKRSGWWFRDSQWNLPKEVLDEIDGEYGETNVEFHAVYLNGQPRAWLEKR